MKTPKFLMASGSAASLVLSFLPSALSGALVNYTPDSSTLHLYTFNEAAGGSSTSNAGSAGGNALSVSENSTTGGTNTSVLSTTMLGQAGYSGFGNAASVAKVTSTTNPQGNQGLGFDFSANGAYSQGSGTSVAAQDRITNFSTYFPGSYTLEAMVNLPSLANANAQRSIISFESNITASRSMYLRIDNGNLQLGNAGSFRSIAIPTIGPDAFVADTWFHVAIVHDSVALTTQFYWTLVDASRTSASALGSAFTGAQTPQNNTAGTPNLMIGSDSRQGMTESLGGLIDNVRISNTARTAGGFVFVPEPSSLLLAGLGSLILLKRRR